MKKILVIEDNQEIRENIAEILDLAGYQVVVAENGKIGISIALSEQPDLILCDIMMPVLDGYGVLPMLQQHVELQIKPFIFLTAKSEQAEIRKGMGMGADDYIIKPFDTTEVLNSVAARLKKAELLKRPFANDLEGMNQLISASTGNEHLKELKEGRNTNHYRKKQTIYTEGNHPSKLFYILKGKVKTYLRNDDGKELIVGLYNEGDFLGYTPLMENKTYKETAEALEDTELALIPRSEFDQLLGSNPAVMKKFVAILARNVEENQEQLLALAYNSLRKKVADTLVTLNRKYNPENNSAFIIDMSRDNLAAIAGVAKESMIRMLSELKDEFVLEIEGSRIRITDYGKLEKMHN
jgi:CRP-like cAMP-binding protein